MPQKIKEKLPFETKEKWFGNSLKDLLEKQEEKTIKKLKGNSQKESEFLLNRLKEI